MFNIFLNSRKELKLVGQCYYTRCKVIFNRFSLVFPRECSRNFLRLDTLRIVFYIIFPRIHRTTTVSSGASRDL